MWPRRFLPLLCLSLLAGCGGGGSPSGPTGPVPSPSAGFSVHALVFYDENANGRLDADEAARVPDVEVRVAGRTARSQRNTGLVVLEGVSGGAHQPSIAAETLPPFFGVGAVAGVQVPQVAGATLMVPLILPVRGPRTNVYMAFGDSITRGELGSSNYPAKLQARLHTHFAYAEVSNRGADATNSYEAVERIRRNLSLGQPAYTLILYGTNDWHDQTCQGAPPCRVADNLRTVILEVKNFGSLPFISTILPVNPAINPGRNQWVAAVNDTIRAVARSEGAFLVDAYAYFQRQSDPARLYVDEVHLSDAGHEILAEAFFEAVAHGRSAPTGSSQGAPRRLPFSFTLP